MKRSTRVGLVVGVFALCLCATLHAETRGTPYTEDVLLRRCSKVFVGEVLDTRTFAPYARTVPTRVRVLVSVKGNVPHGDRGVVPKDPGHFVYFAEEFTAARKGGVGVFFVGTEGQPDLLMGYKQVPDPRR
jgi:hypothetical protein